MDAALQGWTITTLFDPYTGRSRWVLRRDGKYVGDYPTERTAYQAFRILIEQLDVTDRNTDTVN